jgi:hypothetical protein
MRRMVHAPIGTPGETMQQEALHAFIALGGKDDGSGTVDETLLTDMMRRFGLTVRCT